MLWANMKKLSQRLGFWYIRFYLIKIFILMLFALFK